MQMIDYVVPMVFTDDEKWREEYSQTLGRPAGNANDSPRWRSWGTEELLIKSVLQNMPWIRRVYIILSGESQVKPWMNNLSDKIKIVFHREFIPDKYLPCFVSRTIEMFLGDIPGLADRFIYGNDDMYPVGPLQPEDFFQQGKPCQDFKEVPYEDKTYINNIYKRSCFNELNMVAGDFSRRFTNTYLLGQHSMAAMMRKTCKTLWKNHSEEIEASISQSRTDHSMNQYIYSYYQHLSGKYVQHVPSNRYVSMWDGTQVILAAILDKKLKVVCVNDDEVANTVWEKVAVKVRAALEERLNIEKSKIKEDGEGTADNAAVD